MNKYIGTKLLTLLPCEADSHWTFTLRVGSRLDGAWFLFQCDKLVYVEKYLFGSKFEKSIYLGHEAVVV